MNETLGIIKKTTGCFGAMQGIKFNPDGNREGQILQFQLGEDAFQNLVSELDLIDSVFYQDIYGVVDYAGCQFFYLTK